MMLRANHGLFRCGKTPGIPPGTFRPYSVASVAVVDSPVVDRLPRLILPPSMLGVSAMGAPTLVRTGPTAPTTWTFTYSSLYGTQSGTTQAALSDGDIQSGASTFGTNSGSNQWIKADFGSTFTVSNVLVRAIGNSAPGGWNASYTNGLEIHYSTDDVNWTLLTTTSGHTNDEAAPRTYVMNQPARYVRLNRPSGYGAVGDLYFN